jgi:hypothetical protein
VVSALRRPSARCARSTARVSPRIVPTRTNSATYSIRLTNLRSASLSPTTKVAGLRRFVKADSPPAPRGPRDQQRRRANAEMALLPRVAQTDGGNPPLARSRHCRTRHELTGRLTPGGREVIEIVSHFSRVLCHIEAVLQGRESFGRPGPECVVVSAFSISPIPIGLHWSEFAACGKPQVLDEAVSSQT